MNPAELHAFAVAAAAAAVPVQTFLSHPVVLESICYHTRVKRLINESNTTGGLNFFGRVAEAAGKCEECITKRQTILGSYNKNR